MTDTKKNSALADPVPAKMTDAADYVLMPAKLTAENGAKAALAGEFAENINLSCPECDGEDSDDCEICGGSGDISYPVTVEWTTIKRIYEKAVEVLAAPAQPQEQPVAAQQEARHELYTSKDMDKPASILNPNGEVVLGLCKRCGKAESDLAGPCIGPSAWHRLVISLGCMFEFDTTGSLEEVAESAAKARDAKVSKAPQQDKCFCDKSAPYSCTPCWNEIQAPQQEAGQALAAYIASGKGFSGTSAREMAHDAFRKGYAAAQSAPAVPDEREAWMPYLSDCADGVKGHYAIARWHPDGYREVWNLHSHRWASASEDVLTLDQARELMRKLTIPTASAPAQPTVPEDTKRLEFVMRHLPRHLAAGMGIDWNTFEEIRPAIDAAIAAAAPAAQKGEK